MLFDSNFDVDISDFKVIYVTSRQWLFFKYKLWNLCFTFYTMANYNDCLMFIYFWEKERDSGGRAERKGDTESKAGSRLPAVSTEHCVTLELMNHEIMTWVKVGCLPNWATQVPLLMIFFKFIYFERNRESVSGGGVKRERIPNRFHAVRAEPDLGLISQTMRSLPEQQSRVRDA